VPVRDEAHNLQTEDVTMCRLIKAITYLMWHWELSTQ